MQFVALFLAITIASLPLLFKVIMRSAQNELNKKDPELGKFTEQFVSGVLKNTFGKN